MNKNTYFLATGEIDKKRLEILNRLYNPTTYSFLLDSGLGSGMKVLEIGCGYGHTAIWLAQQVLPNGIVYAIDYSQDTLVIARENAKKAGISNIEFIHLDIVNLNSLNEKFDFFYGRWVLEFCKPAINHLHSIYDLLNSNAIFIYEASSFLNPGHFSFPENAAVKRWNELAYLNADKSNAELNLAHQMYHDLKNIGYKNIYARGHQPILVTPEEKSVYRLALISAKNSWIRNNILSEAEIDAFIDEFITIENNNSIIMGFYNNILLRGTK